MNLSLENRLRPKNQVVFDRQHDKETGLGIKAATITHLIKGVGQPEPALRDWSMAGHLTKPGGFPSVRRLQVSMRRLQWSDGGWIGEYSEKAWRKAKAWKKSLSAHGGWSRRTCRGVQNHFSAMPRQQSKYSVGRSIPSSPFTKLFKKSWMLPIYVSGCAL